MENNHRICILVPYFGTQWPQYFYLFLNSCSYNPFIDIIFLTNIAPPEQYPSNVTFKTSGLHDFSDRLRKYEGLDIELKHPYLLCDYKPMYGWLYPDIISEYTHWGYADIDLVFGHLSRFILPLLDEGYDVISFRREIISGSLAVFRNAEKTNELFRRSGHYLRALQSDTENYKGLDESAGDNRTWKNGSLLELPPQCMTYIIARADADGEIRAYFETMNREIIFPDEKIIFDKGTVRLGDQELAYYHFVCNKGRPEYIFPKWKEIPEKYFITDTGFYKSTDMERFSSLSRMRRGKAVYRKLQRKIRRSLMRLFN